MPKETGTVLLERIVTLEGQARAAHHRIDKAENDIRSDLVEIKESLKDMASELKELIAWQNRSKGMFAMVILVAGIAGSLISKVLSGLFHL